MSDGWRQRGRESTRAAGGRSGWRRKPARESCWTSGAYRVGQSGDSRHCSRPRCPAWRHIITSQIGTKACFDSCQQLGARVLRSPISSPAEWVNYPGTHARSTARGHHSGVAHAVNNGNWHHSMISPPWRGWPGRGGALMHGGRGSGRRANCRDLAATAGGSDVVCAQQDLWPQGIGALVRAPRSAAQLRRADPWSRP